MMIKKFGENVLKRILNDLGKVWYYQNKYIYIKKNLQSD